MADDQVSVEISIEEREALKALTKLTRGIDNFEKNSVSSVKKTDRAFDSFKGNLVAIATSNLLGVLGRGITDFASASLDAAAASEKIRTQLEVLTGSQEKAANLYRELTDFSATTPFQLQGIAEASAQLLSFGFEAETVQQRIEKIGEVAAGSGSDLKEVALIYGQVAAAGKLTGERLLQLQERAVPIGSALANTLGVAESRVKDLVSSGVVGFDQFEKAFNSLSEAGGLFEGAIEKQSQTINGVFSTLSDNVFILQSELGSAFAPEVADAARLITSSLQELTRAVINNKEAISTAISFVGDYIDVYANVATAIVGSKSELENLDEEIAANVDTLGNYQRQLDELRQRKGTWLEDPALIKQQEQLVAQQSQRIDELIQKRKTLLTQNQQQDQTGAAGDITPDPESVAAKEEMVNQTVLEKRRELQLKLDEMRAEQGIKEQEREIAQEEATLERREKAIEKLREFEISKAQAQFEIEQEKNAKLADQRSKDLANQTSIAKREIAIQEAQAKAEKAITDARVKNREQMVSGFAVATRQAAAIAKQGTREQKALATAAAVINTYQAGTRAFKDYPYPANLAVLATTVATGLAQVSQIQKQSFATGGVVGGFSGATLGSDNTTVNARNGEMFLNANQQRRLFDIAEGRTSNDNSGLVEAINRLANQENVIMINEREIARSVRNQRLEGFAV